ncbi:MAG: DUF4430 domain-containing protein [Clostridia bacterium]|nr:DUF4430 domain-containing protein [Clostridia bacterium]
MLKNKRIVLPIIIVVLILAVFCVFNLRSAENYYNEASPTEGDFVTIEINAATILENFPSLDEALRDEKYVPSDGIILPKTIVYIEDGDSVFDVLERVTRENKIQMEYSESPGSIYVEGINYLYEFSCGELSGWMYSVNGDFAQVGCESYILENGDKIKWLYTCDLGRDIGGGIE